jgi:hypothetical protein
MSEDRRSRRSPVCCLLSSPCNLVPAATKRLPQHHFLEHSQPMFLPQHERPSSQPTHKKETLFKKYISVLINLYNFGYQTGDRNDSGPHGSSHSMSSI